MQKTYYPCYQGPFGWQCWLDTAIAAMMLAMLIVALVLIGILPFSGPYGLWLSALEVYGHVLAICWICLVLNRLIRPTLLRKGQVVWLLDLSVFWNSTERCLPDQVISSEFRPLADREVPRSQPTMEGKKWSMTIGDYEVLGSPGQVGQLANWLLRLYRSRNTAIARAASWLVESGCAVEEASGSCLIVSPTGKQWEADRDQFAAWQDAVSARAAELQRAAQLAARGQDVATVQAGIVAIATASSLDRSLSPAESGPGVVADAALSRTTPSRMTGSFVPVDESTRA